MPEVTNNSADQFGKFGQIRPPNWGGGGCYCRLQMPLKLALGVRGAVARRRLGALEGGGYLPPFQCIPGHTHQPASPQLASEDVSREKAEVYSRVLKLEAGFMLHENRFWPQHPLPTASSPARPRSDEVWRLSIVRSALEPEVKAY